MLGKRRHARTLLTLTSPETRSRKLLFQFTFVTVVLFETSPGKLLKMDRDVADATAALSVRAGWAPSLYYPLPSRGSDLRASPCGRRCMAHLSWNGARDGASSGAACDCSRSRMRSLRGLCTSLSSTELMLRTWAPTLTARCPGRLPRSRGTRKLCFTWYYNVDNYLQRGGGGGAGWGGVG